MNTTLSAPPGRHDHPPQHQSVPSPERRRVGLIDRLALHLGVALVTWSRRPMVRRRSRDHPLDRASLTLRREVRLAVAEREREAERRLLLTVSQWRA